MKFSIQVFQKSILVRSMFGTAIFDRVMPFRRRKFLIICSFRSFIFFAEEALIVMKLNIKVYHEII